MSKDTGPNGPVATTPPAQSVQSPSTSSPSSDMLTSTRRLRIDEIKERRRRFHKETAERWILEQQFGVRDGRQERSDSVDASEKPDRNSFVNAFEFFSKGTGGAEGAGGGNASSGSDSAGKEQRGRNLRLDVKSTSGRVEWRSNGREDESRGEFINLLLEILKQNCKLLDYPKVPYTCTYT